MPTDLRLVIPNQPGRAAQLLLAASIVESQGIQITVPT